MSEEDNKNQVFISTSSVDELVDLGSTLRNLPFWNLYHYLNSGRKALYSQLLPLMSEDQRQKVFDLENWQKQDFSLEKYEFWLKEVHKSQNLELYKSFVSKQDFQLFLKGKFQISTFDLEFPEYPDHDYFFLTDDNQFLVEFHEDFELGDELRYSLRVFYEYHGVSKAYEILLQLISDSYFQLQEENYLDKKKRLAEIGVHDYFESLQLLRKYKSFSDLDKYIDKKMHQALNVNYFSYESNDDLVLRKELVNLSDDSLLFKELSLLKNEMLKTNFDFFLTRLANSILQLEGKLNSSLSEVRSSMTKVRETINLSLSYLRSKYEVEKYADSLLDRFDISEVYNLGLNLINLRKKKLKLIIDKYFQENELYFLGENLNIFIEDFTLNQKIRVDGQLENITNCKFLDFLDLKLNFIVSLSSLLSEYKKAVFGLKSLSKLNYNNDEIDFEVILLTKFISFALNLDNSKDLIPVLEFNDFKRFIELIDYSQFIAEFLKEFNLSDFDYFEPYLYELLKDHFDGLDPKELDKSMSTHLSGVLLLV